MTSAVLGKLSTLQLGDGASPQVYTTIAEVLRVSEIGSANPEINVTNLDSTAQEYIPGLADGATVEFEMNWVAGNAQQQALRDAVAAGSTINLRMVWTQVSPNTLAKFDIAALNFTMAETSAEAQVTARFSGRISGSIVWLN